MQPVPEFIPLPKKKEMFALSSWRESPRAQGSTGGPQPSPLMAAADAIRGGTPSAAPASGLDPHTSTSANTHTAASAEGAGADAKSGKKSGPGAGRRLRGAKASAAQPRAPADVDDFFVHVYLPPGVAYQTFSYETLTQVTPLRIFDVGLPTVLFPRRAATDERPTPPAAATTDAGRSGAAGPAMRLSPFATPVVCAASPVAGVPVHDEEGREQEAAGLPPMALPPPEHSGTVNGAPGGAKNPPAAAGAGDLAGMFQVSMLFAEQAEADKTAAFVKRRWPTAVVQVVSRNRAMLNASLVLKSLPSMAKTEYILEELENLPFTPSYMRVHRGERGVYKNVVFVKYPDREAAEDSKVRLDRLMIGARSLKVEFKKKSKPPGAELAAGGGGSGGAAGGGGGACGSGTAPGAATAAGEDDEPANRLSSQMLQQTVRDLRVSTEHEGFAYRREELTKGDIKLLKQLCQSYDLIFEMNDAKVTVRRVLGGNHGPGTHSGGPSPVLRPHQPSPTPAWAPATPAPLRPMDFKGIRHWKEISGQQNTLGIVRPIGPEDGGPPFSAGRGRPL